MRIAHDVIDGVRYAAVIDGKKLHALYARPDDDRPWHGDVLKAKILRYVSVQRAYFLDIGGEEAFLPHKDATLFAGGETIFVRVERPATTIKNIRCTLSDMSEKSRGPDLILQAQSDYPDISDVSQGLQDFDAAIIALRDKTVDVQSGLSIVIEETQAFVAIDVNNADPNLKPIDANRAAFAELLRQMRLRNLSGQIIVDCLRLHNAKHKTELQDELKKNAQGDPRAIALYGFTRLGLFEMTRERVGLPLSEILALQNV